MTLANTSSEVEKILELQIDGRDDEARKIMEEMAQHDQQKIMDNAEEKIRDMHAMNDRRFAHIDRGVSIIAGLTGLNAAYWGIGYAREFGVPVSILEGIGIILLTTIAGTMIGWGVARWSASTTRSQ